MKAFLIATTVMAALLITAGAQAADRQSRVMIDYSVSVAPAHRQAFEAGMKSYKQCLREHHSKFGLNVYTSVTGNTSLYGVVSNAMTWSQLDSMSHKSPCDAVLLSDVMPHVSSMKAGFLKLMPGYSHIQNSKEFGNHLVEVVSYTLNDGMQAFNAFKKGAKQIYDAQNKSSWPASSMLYQVTDAGAGAPNFLLVVSFKNWTDFGTEPNPSLMKLLNDTYGKSQAKDILKSLNDAIKSGSAQVYRYVPSLSYEPSSH